MRSSEIDALDDETKPFKLIRRWMVLVLWCLLGIYIGSYRVFRNTHQQIEQKTKTTYVIFPQQPIALYFFYRPITYVDQMLTGMKFHLGPHQE